MPASARPLIALADEWAVGDDFERERRVDDASRAELERLVDAVEAADPSLWEWLSGPESRGPEFSQEYVAMTALTEAFDSARVKLQGYPGDSRSERA
jgi:hypothetical protein